MFRPLELFVGLRYLRAKRRNHFISFISLISMLGIAVGVAALIIVLSVMNGFEQELRERILSMTSHGTIVPQQPPLRDWKQLQQRVLEDPRVVGVAPYVAGEGMLANGQNLTGVFIRGVLVDQEPAVSDVAHKMLQGSFENLIAGARRVVVGKTLALMLGVAVGDPVTLMIARDNRGASLVPKMRRFTVSGIFEAGHFEYDSTLAFVHLEDAAVLFGLDAGVTGVRLKLDDMFQAPQIVTRLSGELGDDYELEDWTQRHTTYFRAIKTEKTVMFVILSIIVGVAVLNIVSTLVMVVTDKRTDIAVLRTIGMKPRSVMAVFMVQGLLIGLIGTLLGLTLGVGLALNVETVVPWLERVFGVQVLPSDVYYISDVPSELHTADVWRVGISAFLLSAISTLYPAKRAADVQPAQALRYE